MIVLWNILKHMIIFIQFPLLKKCCRHPKWSKCFLLIWIPTGKANGSRDGTSLWEGIVIITRIIQVNKEKLQDSNSRKPCFGPCSTVGKERHTDSLRKKRFWFTVKGIESGVPLWKLNVLRIYWVQSKDFTMCSQRHELRLKWHNCYKKYNILDVDATSFSQTRYLVCMHPCILSFSPADVFILSKQKWQPKRSDGSEVRNDFKRLSAHRTGGFVPKLNQSCWSEGAAKPGWTGWSASVNLFKIWDHWVK